MAVETRAPSPPARVPDPSRHRRRGAFLLAVAAWNVWLWITRTINLLEDPTPRTAGFVAVHAVLYGVSFLLAIAVGTLGWRMWRESRSAGSP